MSAAQLRMRVLERPAGPGWSAFAALYRASFPAHEREPLADIAVRLHEGRYRLTLARLDDRVAGFHLIDRVPALDHAMLCYLAVAPGLRGRGLGRHIARHCFAHYAEPGIHWLFIEAAERQARFYGRLGALRLDLDYAVPHFTDPGTTPMQLMALCRPRAPDRVGRDFLCRIIEHVFIDGYGLGRGDPRLAAQCARVPDAVALEPWPPQGDDHA